MARQIITTANAPSSPLPFESTGRVRRRDPRGTVRPSEYNRTIATYCPQKTERVCRPTSALGESV